LNGMTESTRPGARPAHSNLWRHTMNKKLIKSGLRERLLVVSLCLGTILFASPALAQGCAACTSSATCEATTSGANSCTVRDGTCSEEFSLCVTAVTASRAIIRVAEAETEFGTLALTPVGESLFAAWRCTGELLYIAERRPNGQWAPLAVADYRTRYSYQAVHGHSYQPGPQAAVLRSRSARVGEVL
jgi:hypothetical protein